MKLTDLMIRMLQSGADAPDRSLRDVDGRALSGLIRRGLVEVTRGEHSYRSRRKGWWVTRTVVTDVKINDAGRAALAEATGATAEKPREPREGTTVPLGLYFRTPEGIQETLQEIIDVPGEPVRWMDSERRTWVASECMAEHAWEWTHGDAGVTEYAALDVLTTSHVGDPSKDSDGMPLSTMGALPMHADDALVQLALHDLGHLAKARLGDFGWNRDNTRANGLQVAPLTRNSVVAGWWVNGDMSRVYNSPEYTSPELEIIAHAFQKAGWKAIIGKHHVRAIAPEDGESL